MEPPVPAQIGKYRIDGVLGRGAMGVVYLAFDTLIHRKVAIKTMASLASADAEMRERFYQEARAIGNLAHRNIVVVHDLGEENSTPYIVMEYLPGTDLAGLLRQGAEFPLSDRLRILSQVARALEHAHERGIVHRDVKPSNIRVLPDGAVKLMDFGIAKLGTSEMTVAGSVLGTPDYMSPEQVRGESSDHRSDLFSFGITLYEALSGIRPFTVDNAQGTLYRLVNEEAPPLERMFDGQPVSPTLLALTEQCLQKAPGARPQSFAEVHRVLREALEDCPETSAGDEMVERGRRRLEALDYDGAEALAREAIDTYGELFAAKDLLAAIERARTVNSGIESARGALASGDFEVSREFLAQVLQVDGSHTFARRLMDDATRGAAARAALEEARGAAEDGRLTDAYRLLDEFEDVPELLRGQREEVAALVAARREEQERRAREKEREERERARRERAAEAQGAVERGIRLFGEGRSMDAIAEWRRALELDPGHVLAAQMLEEIGER
jgi:tRNA A-37 threonylcarbamoyl transferase component Bud32